MPHKLPTSEEIAKLWDQGLGRSYLLHTDQATAGHHNNISKRLEYYRKSIIGNLLLALGGCALFLLAGYIFAILHKGYYAILCVSGAVLYVIERLARSYKLLETHQALNSMPRCYAQDAYDPIREELIEQAFEWAYNKGYIQLNSLNQWFFNAPPDPEVPPPTTRDYKDWRT